MEIWKNVVGYEGLSYEYNNTYNGVAVRRGEKIKGYTPWNKGKSMPDSFKQKVSDGMKRYYQTKNNGGDIQ